MQDGHWLTNFSISLVLSASVPELMIGNNVSHALLQHVQTDTRVLSTTIYDLLNFNKPDVVAASDTTPWGRHPITTILSTTEHVLAPLNLDNNHWVALRTSKRFNMAEVFLTMGSKNERERALVYAAHLVAYLVGVGHLSASPTIRTRTSPFWAQYDSSTCGLFTLGILLSLIQGRRIDLDCSGPALGPSDNNDDDRPLLRARDWRRYFAQIVVGAVQANTTSGLGGGSVVVDLVGED